MQDVPAKTTRSAPAPERLLLDTAEVATLLGVSERWVRAKATTGDFPRKVKLGRLARYRRSDVERWLAKL